MLALLTQLAASVHYLAFYSLASAEVVLLQLPRVTPLAQLVAIIGCAALADSALRKSTRSSLGVAALFGLFAGPIWLATGYFSRPELLFCAAAGSFVWMDCARAAGKDPFRALIASLLVLVVAKGIFVSISYEHYFVYDPRKLRGDPWIDAAAWAGANTTEDATFVTPPSEEGFTFYSRRSAVADFVANPHLRSHIAEWRRRLADLSGGELPACAGFRCLEELERSYGRLTEGEIMEIGSKYGASYAIAASGRYSLRAIYDNGTYAIYDLRTRA